VQPITAAAKQDAEKVLARSERLLALDTFRGFTMFWIVGGEALREAVSKGRGARGPAPLHAPKGTTIPER
jgi:hypothetical protein